jgi:hypothetical protein
VDVVDSELALEEQVEAQAELVVVQVALLEQVAVVVVDWEQELHQVADAQQVVRVQSS